MSVFTHCIRLRVFSCLLVCIFLLPATPVLSRTLYVSIQQGNDANTGLSEDQAWASIGHAAARIQPGDTVSIGPGVYFEHIELKTAGTAEKPIVFKADRVEKNRVMITGADPAIRQGQCRWTLDDARRKLYSTPYAGEYPARVLYSGTDLYPYASLDQLKAFSCGENLPGPLHGFYFDEQAKRLYVRLHASGRYGSTDPAQQIMAVAPPTGAGTNGTYVRYPHEYNFGILTGINTSAHVILEGLSFETPGVAGVYTQSSDVVVRNCWFTGCRTGVAGVSMRGQPRVPAERVEVAYCDFTMFPAFEDALESAAAMDAEQPYARFYWWQRKSSGHGVAKGPMDYETGFASRIGIDWSIHHNRIHSCFEGLSADATTLSVGLRIHDNVFDGMVDNGIEFEDHARDLHVYRNVFVNNFSPLSWQPLKAMPWPGPIYVHQNLFYETPQVRQDWDHGQVTRTVFKIGCSAKQWRDKAYAPKLQEVNQEDITVPAPGLLIYNNTVWLPQRTNLFAVIGGMKAHLHNVLLANNVILIDSILGKGEPDGQPRSNGGPRSYMYRNNLLVMSGDATTQAALSDAQMVGSTVSESQLLLREPQHGDFTPLPGSPVFQSVLTVPGAVKQYPMIGAIGETEPNWFKQPVGPQVAK